MAFSEAQQIKLATILGTTPDIIATHLTSGAVTVSSELQSAVEAQIALWDAGIGTNYTNIEPNLKNFGARISAGSARTAIRSAIANLLERPDWATGGSKLQRG